MSDIYTYKCPNCNHDHFQFKSCVHQTVVLQCMGCNMTFTEKELAERKWRNT